MKFNARTEYVARDHILDLLSDEEVASVSMAEGASRLSVGDEYLDLARLDQGVRCASGADAPIGRVLPRKSVPPETWGRILTELGPLQD